MENQKRDWLLPASILIAALLISGAVIYSTGLKNISQPVDNQPETGEEQISSEPQIGDDVILGDPNAPVTLIEFGDYQCPFCGKFFKETEPLIRKNYIETGKVKMIYKDLAFLGPESTAAAEAAECARDQKKYWQYHDALFEEEIKDGAENNGNLNSGLFEKIAAGLGMNTDEFLSCYNSRKYKDEVAKDVEEAKAAMGQRISTPTSFINGEMIQGAYPYEVFAEAIDKALNKE